MSHDSRYETECPHGHGWYFYEDGCAHAGCENAPPVSGGVPEPLNDQADELLSDVEEYGHLGADFSKRATAILKALAALKYSDVAALGGVPEQGLREAAQRILDHVGGYYDGEPESRRVGCSQCCDTSLTVGDLRALRAAVPRTHEQLAEIIGPPDCCEEFERQTGGHRGDCPHPCPEPAECELEAIAALLTSAVSQVGNWRDRARYLFDRGVRIQDGAALERPRPAKAVS